MASDKVRSADLRPASRGGSGRFSPAEQRRITTSGANAASGGTYAGMAAGATVGGMVDSEGRAKKREAARMSRTVSEISGHGRVKTAVKQAGAAAQVSKPSTGRALFSRAGLTGMAVGGVGAGVGAGLHAQNKEGRRIEAKKLNKAFKMPSMGGIGAGAAKATQKVGRDVNRKGIVNQSKGAMKANSPFGAATQSSGQRQMKIGAGQRFAGNKIRQAGNAMAKKPELTGVGVTSAGVGLGMGGAYSIFNPNKTKQKVTKSMNPFGVDNHVVSKRRDSKGPGAFGVVGSAAGGSLAGGIGGAMIGGGGPKKYAQNVKTGAATGVQMAVDHEMPHRPGTGYEEHGFNPKGFKAEVKGQHANTKAVQARLKTVPGMARQMRGGKIGSAAGAVGAASAYIHHKNKLRSNALAKSAFGIEHEVSKSTKYKKNNKEMTDGRKVLGAAFGPYHGLVAGKGAGGKARSAGTQFGGAVGGGVIGGAAVGRLSPRAAAAGAGVGSLVGSYKATEHAHKKGWLKRQ